jgi:hypothetical protein
MLVYSGTELDNAILNAIDNAPTVEPRIEYGTDGQPYRLFMSGGQVVTDMLQGWRYEERRQGEWVRKEDVMNSIAKQYSAHNELVPIWLSIGEVPKC